MKYLNKLITFAFYGLPAWESEHCLGINFYYYTYGVSINRHDYYVGIYLHLWRWNFVVGLIRSGDSLFSELENDDDPQ